MQDEYIVEQLMARFWAKVAKGPDCWEWTGAPDHNGYGKIELKSQGKRWVFVAHRYSWVLHNGPIPDGLYVCHHCDNRLCVNPAHLFLGTAKDNSDDMVAKGRAKYVGPDSANARTARLTPEKVREIRKLRGEGMLMREIATMFGVAEQTVGHVLSGYTWRKI